MKSVILLVATAAFSVGAIADSEVCKKIGEAQAGNDHDTVIELASKVKPEDLESCKLIARDVRTDINLSFD
ncbi:hypothetical protein A6E01_19955 (plasmid) [Vibrio breoganii]|uniref:Uncharacterized protein n=1 Tax=Vibrio breoganii TaxID=553239 RepID=A0AAN0XZH1_9VIBR|nr:hypothetical protein [Vibrio breoganii]ANO35489.1 hypothetical protein A6E01_19955 [Vibrio breoganii]PML13804.1 hypothetical protein BCT84_12490 [Vibrio breoganii]